MNTLPSSACRSCITAVRPLVTSVPNAAIVETPLATGGGSNATADGLLSFGLFKSSAAAAAARNAASARMFT